MRRTTYKTIAEATELELRGQRILILPKYKIDKFVEAGLLRCKDRQLYFNDIPVYQDCPLKMDENANQIKIRAINLKDLKDFD